MKFQERQRGILFIFGIMFKVEDEVVEAKDDEETEENKLPGTRMKTFTSLIYFAVVNAIFVSAHV